MTRKYLLSGPLREQLRSVERGLKEAVEPTFLQLAFPTQPDIPEILPQQNIPQLCSIFYRETEPHVSRLPPR